MKQGTYKLIKPNQHHCVPANFRRIQSNHTTTTWRCIGCGRVTPEDAREQAESTEKDS